MGRVKIGGNKLKKSSLSKKTDNDKKSVTFKTDDLDVDDENVNEKDIKQTKSINKIGKIQFKATKKLTKHETKSTFTKLNNAKKAKYNDIKTNFLDQIKKADVIDSSKESTANKNELNFVKKELPTRLTNALIKSLLSKSNESADKLAKTNESSSLDSLRGVKKLNKKTKSKLKKQVWQERISSIKTHLKESIDKAKREKTVIVGDIKPIMDTLVETTSSKSNQDNSNTTTSTDISNLTRKERRAKILERESSKQIQKQSIRTKKSNDDMALFNQLIDYPEFTKNPLDTLKKHLTST